jgi:hypothetical protein
VLVSTHDLELALRVADAVWLVDRSGAVHTATPAEVIAAGAVAASFDTGDLSGRCPPTAGVAVDRHHPPARLSRRVAPTQRRSRREVQAGQVADRGAVRNLLELEVA